MPKLTRHRPTAIVYLQDCSWAKESRADFIHLTPKDEEPLFNSLCEKSSTHEKAVQRDQSAEWIGL